MNKHFRLSGSYFLKLEDLGVRAAEVLRRAGLPQRYADQPRVLLNTQEWFAFWRAIGEVSSNPAIGLALGTENKTERFCPMGLAALSTENFGAAIDQMARYKQLTCPEEIAQEKDDEEWSIQFRWLLAEEVEPPILIDCCFAWLLSTARVGTGTRLSPSASSWFNRGRTSKPWNVILDVPSSAKAIATLSSFAPPTPSAGSLPAMPSFWPCWRRSLRKS